MTAIAFDERRAATWGIGRYYVGDTAADFSMSWEDRERDTDWAVEIMRDHGIEHGSGVVVVAAMPESPWFDPFETAARRLRAPYSLAEVQPFEAFRTGLYAKWVPTRMIFGIPRVVVEHLGGTEAVAEQLGPVPVVIARPDAFEPLRAAGIDPYVVTRIGPALAVECPSRAGAHVNSSEWAVTAVDGELHISTVGPRMYQVTDLALGIRGDLAVEPCACGRTDVRITIATDEGVSS
jgi:hypothetical protein